MARRAADLHMRPVIREDPLKTQNRALSMFTVALMASLLALVLWFTGSGQTGGPPRAVSGILPTLNGDRIEPTSFATLEASMAAYHLAFGPDASLYVAGPSLSSFDSILRVSPDGEVVRFFTGLGRPQGMAFDRQGNLYVAASRRGHRGVVRITPDAEAEIVVAGIGLVGLCFDDHGNMIVASNRELYRLPLGIEGYWPF